MRHSQISIRKKKIKTAFETVVIGKRGRRFTVIERLFERVATILDPGRRAGAIYDEKFDL